MKRCPTCGQLPKRTIDQNKRYWALLHAIADKLETADGKFSAETWHLYFKSRFIGMEEIRLPNRKIVQQPKSTTELDKSEFTDYMFNVEAWAVEHGVVLDYQEE